MSRTTKVSVSLTPDAKALVARLAGTLDVPDLIVASALIQHAARSDVARIVATWVADHPQRITARVVERIAWKQEHGDGPVFGEGQPPASTYRYGEWVLFRLGDPSARGEPGSGWYLEGPSINQPRFLDRQRRSAQREAAGIIRAYEHAS